MQEIISHPNYRGLPIKKKKNGSPSWVATAKTDIGLRRKAWAADKATELGIAQKPGFYAKVMYQVHPTKVKVCHVCGEKMSLSYIYPNAVFSRALIKQYVVDIDIYDDIYVLWDKIIKEGFGVSDIITFMNRKFSTSFPLDAKKSTVLAKCEEICRLEGKRLLGPGAMSDFPDRFDGFHSYNRCHRPTEDKGRSKENMKTYTRDRRAYEYWSDGNIQAANNFMGSKYFQGLSADHVGPISLGFIHDSHYLRPMQTGDNSAKRDRLSIDTINEILLIHQKTGIYPMSWYSSAIWDFIVQNYKDNEKEIGGTYRALLKQNMSNFMYILKEILLIGKIGEDFLINALVSPKKNDFLYKYEFDNLGNIISKNKRNLTARASGEFTRFARIAIEAVIDYNEKANRNIPHYLLPKEKQELAIIIRQIIQNDDGALLHLEKLMNAIQSRLLETIQQS